MDLGMRTPLRSKATTQCGEYLQNRAQDKDGEYLEAFAKHGEH